jgi:hypothetical protein
MYRLFWLPPGEYYVCAKPLDLRRSSEMMHIPPPSRFGTYQQQMRPTVTAVNASRLLDDGSLVDGQYVPVCFPGTRDERRASPIRLRAGETVAGVDVSVAESLVRTFHVRGVVVNGATGAPVAAGLQVIPREPPAILLIPTGGSNADGTFDLWGALPGPDYVVASGGGLNGLLAVDVGGADVNGVTLTVWPGATIPGRIQVGGGGASNGGTDTAGVTVTLRRSPAINGLADLVGGSSSLPAPGRTPNASTSDGSFSLNGVPPGDYAVVVTGLPEESYVESIHLGVRDVLREGLHVDGPVKGQLDIVLGGRGGVVEGRVVSLQRQPAAGATVVAIPDAGLRGRHDRFKVTVSDDQGRFELKGLAPGSYDVLAWEDVEPGAWLVTDAILDDLAFGRPVYVPQGGRMTVDVTLIPAER